MVGIKADPLRNRCPVIVAMMLMTADQRVMEGFKIPWPLRFLGWATAGAMGLAVLTMAATWMI